MPTPEETPEVMPTYEELGHGTPTPEAMPTYEQVARALRALAVDRDMYSGIPVPQEEPNELVLEPRYPYQFPPKPPTEELVEIINSWHNPRHCGMVNVYKVNGRAKCFITPNGAGKRLEFALTTLGSSHAWLLEAETVAILKLEQILKPHQMKYYVLTGTFLERSKRSDIMYLFRKGKPTIAIHNDPDGECRALCALCLHPIGYYRDTHAGAMCPTDDVIAHLVMMRGDEPKFWAHANQHPISDPRSGV